MARSTYDKYTLLKEFLSSGRHTIDECAIFMEQDKRTAYRAIKALAKEPTFRREKNGRQAYFFIEDRAKNENDDIVSNLEKILKISSGSAAESRITAPLLKLTEKLKKREKDALPDAISINSDLAIDLGPFAACDFDKEAEKYDRYLQAIKANKKIRIEYQHSKDGATTKYLLCPLKLIMRIDTLYLYAAYTKETGEEVKHQFVFNQIKRMSTTNETFTPIKVRPADIYRYAFSRWIPNLDKEPPQNIVLEATEAWSKMIFARANFALPEQGKLEERGGKTFLKMNLSITPDFKSWLFGMLDAVKIHEPASLKKDAEEYLKAALKALK